MSGSAVKTRRAPIAPLEYGRRLWLRSWVGAVALFLYAPLVFLIVFSFNDSKANLVWKGFTLKYYGKVFADDTLMVALGNSLTIAFLATLVSVVLGALAAVLLWRFRFPFKASVARKAIVSELPSATISVSSANTLP